LGPRRDKFICLIPKVCPKIDVQLSLGDSVSVSVETNGKGYIGFLVELPGAFVRGRSESELLEKVPGEVRSYLEWLGTPSEHRVQGTIVESHRCKLTVEDADSEILLAADRGQMELDEFRRLAGIVSLSGKTFSSLYNSAQFKDWVDPSRRRDTFYGKTPSTIREIFDHVKNSQHYYLSRIGLEVAREGSFDEVREEGMVKIRGLFDTQGNSREYRMEGESWTVKKVLRRLVWHDRIHGKAIMRILAKQNYLGLIESYEDPFRFGFRNRT
jgi:hypothetical protein